MDGILGEGKGAGQSAARDEMRRGEERRGAPVSLDAGMRCAGRRHGVTGRGTGLPGPRGWGWCACVGVGAGVLGLLADRWLWAGLGRWWAGLTENTWVWLLFGLFG